ncbi:hypothetical protein K7432_009458 [Basidiobolus ranarum]|uniref:Uncharacterized protein n=1 Tax=Basidiobolus ranarum TaxID=34480 RepID=A0ABR2WQ83_9FUNG
MSPEHDLWLGMPVPRKLASLQDAMQVFIFSVFGPTVVWIKAAHINTNTLWQTPVVTGSVFGVIGLLLASILLVWIPLKMIGVPGHVKVSQGGVKLYLPGPPELVRASWLALSYLSLSLACMLVLAGSWAAAIISTISAVIAGWSILHTIPGTLDAAKNNYIIKPPAYLLNARTGKIESAKSKRTCWAKCDWEPEYVAVTRALNLQSECTPCPCASMGKTCVWKSYGSLLCHIAAETRHLGATHIWIDSLREHGERKPLEASTPTLLDSTPYRIFQGAKAVIVPTTQCQCLYQYHPETLTQTFKRHYKKSFGAAISSLFGRTSVKVAKSENLSDGLLCQRSIVEHHISPWLSSPSALQESAFVKNLRLLPVLIRDPYGTDLNDIQTNDLVYEKLENVFSEAKKWSKACAGSLVKEFIRRGSHQSLFEILNEVRDIISTRCGWVVTHGDSELMAKNMMRALATIGDVSFLTVWQPYWTDGSYFFPNIALTVEKQTEAAFEGAIMAECVTIVKQTFPESLVAFTQLLLPIQYCKGQPSVTIVTVGKITGSLFVLSSDLVTDSGSWYVSATTLKRDGKFFGYFAYAISPTSCAEADGHLCAFGIYTCPAQLSGASIHGWRLGATF